MPVITIFSHEFEPIILSGVGNTCRFLVDELLKLGFMVNVITLKYGKFSHLPYREKVDNLAVYRIQIPFYERLLFSVYSGWFSWRNRDIIKKSDIIHSLDSRDAPFICTNGKPLIINYNDYVSSTTPLNIFSKIWEASCLRDRIVRWLYVVLTIVVEKVSALRGTIIIVNSQYTGNIIQKNYNVNHNKMMVVYKGINISEFDTAIQLPKKYDILFVGGNLHKKGIEEFLEIVSLARKIIPEIKCAVIGRGEGYYIKKLKSFIDDKNLSDNIEFIHHVDHDVLIRYYSMSRVFVLPTHRDSLPQVIMEAMAMCIPVVVTPVGGIPEAVEHGVSGYLIEKENVQSYATHIIALVQNPEKCNQMGLAGRKRVEEQFNHKKMVVKYISIYNKLLSNTKINDRVYCGNALGGKMANSCNRREFYEEEGEQFQYNEEIIKSLHHKERLEYCAKLLTKKIIDVKGKAFVLDVGCGEGFGFSLLELPKNTLAVGVDLSFAKLSNAKKLNAENVQFVQADVEKLPFKSDAFDIAISTEVIEHLPKVELYYSETKRVFRNVFILSAPTYNSNPSWIILQVFRYVLRVKPDLKTLMKKYGHFRHYTSCGLLKEAKKNGFFPRYLYGCNVIVLPKIVYKYFPFLEKIIRPMNQFASKNWVLKYFSNHTIIICDKVKGND